MNMNFPYLNHQLYILQWVIYTKIKFLSSSNKATNDNNKLINEKNKSLSNKLIQ